MSKPNLLQAGNDPDCIHHEQIDGLLIGTCRKCGQVKDYQYERIGNIDPAMSASYGETSLGQLAASRKKGGDHAKKANAGKKGKPPDWKAQAWNRMDGQKSNRQEMPDGR